MLDAAPAAAGGVGATALTVESGVLNIFWELASVQAAKREARAARAQSPLAAADGRRTGGCQAARGGAQPRPARVRRVQVRPHTRAFARRVSRCRKLGRRLTPCVAAAAGPAPPRTRWRRL